MTVHWWVGGTIVWPITNWGGGNDNHDVATGEGGGASTMCIFPQKCEYVVFTHTVGSKMIVPMIDEEGEG